jgi:hypothetical protein
MKEAVTGWLASVFSPITGYKSIKGYSLFVYFGYLIREGAFQLRGLELDLKTYKFSLYLTFTFTNQCQSPQKNRVRNVKKSVLGQKCQSRLYTKILTKQIRLKSSHDCTKHSCSNFSIVNKRFYKKIKYTRKLCPSESHFDKWYKII